MRQSKRMESTQWPRSLTEAFLAERSAVFLALGAALSLLLTACSSNKAEPETLPSQTVTQVGPTLEPPPAVPLPPMREVPVTRREKVKVIEQGGSEGKEMTLAEASRKAKQSRATQKPASIRIDDENLGEYAQGGSVIILESAPAAELSPEAQAVAAGTTGIEEGLRSAEKLGDPETPLAARGEDYWRNRALDLRRRWRRTVDQIDELELESAALRQQFYGEEDTYVRDTQIKPSWDRTLDKLTALRIDAGRYEEELDGFIVQGREAGALPGWLREGWELEPTAEERDKIQKIGLHKVVEPDVGLEPLEVQNPSQGGES